MDEPREWFLYESVSEDHDTLTAVPRGDDPYDQYANMITVIEKSAYDKLKAKNDKLKAKIAQLSKGRNLDANEYRVTDDYIELVKLKAHADAMAEALVAMSESWRDGISQEAWDALTAYRKDCPR